MSEHESLRKALAWLLQQPKLDQRAIAEASRHFDLSPLDEEFLSQYFLGGEEGRTSLSKNDRGGDLGSN